MICEVADQLSSFPGREIFTLVITIGFGFFDYIAVPLIGLIVNRTIPDGAPRKQTLTLKDHIFVNFNRVCTFFFMWCLVQCSCSDKYFAADLDSLLGGSTKSNSAADMAIGIAKQLAFFAAVWMPASILVYDFTYTIFHRVLHYNWLYPYIHKHHHLQYCPYRGNVDAINVHPFEYLVGEFNHLFTQAFVSIACQRALGVKPHNLFVLLYIVIAGILSTVNHTRIDLRIPFVYSTWWHDLHHRFPPCNYGQYTMFWDYVFDWYLPETTQSRCGANVAGDGTVAAGTTADGDATPSKSPARPSLVKNSGSGNEDAVNVPSTPTPSKKRSTSASEKRKRI
jgi:sterol desaturase/sphingolipid hydroxylase (fatty acid hydroxylase superfamily)